MANGIHPISTVFLEWESFVDRLVQTVESAQVMEGNWPKVLAGCADGPFSPMPRLFAQALVIRLEKSAASRPMSLELLFEHLAPQSWVRGLLATSCGKSQHPAVRLFLAQVASGQIRSRSTTVQMAEAAGMSVQCLTRLVRCQTGVPAQRHIAARRLLDAAHLLTKTFMGLHEVAVGSGYRHKASLHFYFRLVLGIRPIELRSFYLREACRSYMRGRRDGLFDVWVKVRLPELMTRPQRGGSGAEIAELKIAYALNQVKKGTPIEVVCNQLVIPEATFYVWKEKYADRGTEDTSFVVQAGEGVDPAFGGIKGARKGHRAANLPPIHSNESTGPALSPVASLWKRVSTPTR